MSSDQTAGVVTDSGDYGDLYYNDTHLGGHGDYSWESEEWRAFFQNAARRVVAMLSPTTSLDIGCAKGLLVQALAEAGVDAHGSDISDYAVNHAHVDVRDRLTVASAIEPLEGRWDLISCIEVLEHMSPEDAQTAIDNMCRATDRILFSSTPADFKETTHINIRPTSQWASWFAERGFFRRTDIDLTFMAPWAILFERSDLARPSLVEHYEALLSPLNLELADKRAALLESDRQVAALRRRVQEIEAGPRFVRPDDAGILELNDRMTERDYLIGLEATIVRLTRDLEAARARVKRMRARLGRLNGELNAVRESTTWKLGRAVTRPLGRLRG